jgi:hypothetical protein
MFSTWKRNCQHPTRPNTHSIFICDLRIPKICFAKKTHIQKLAFMMRQQASETTHVDERIENFLKKDNSLMIGA